MATNNVNKIVRGNVNLKPWILSKNPTKIVNGYVQQIYSQVPDHLKEDILRPLLGIQSENRTSLRFTFPIVRIKKPKARVSNSRPVVPKESTSTNINAQRNMLRTPNYRIYNSRKYGSSASSSGTNVLSTENENKRKKMYKSASNLQFRAMSGTAAASTSIAGYTSPARPATKLTGQMKCIEITNAICKDLMSVDKILREKIGVAKTKTPLKVTTKEMSKPELVDASFKGWNHPSTLLLAALRKQNICKDPQPPVVQKAILDRGLSSYCTLPNRKTSSGNKTSSITDAPRKENARYQMAAFAPYIGFREPNKVPSGSGSVKADKKKVEPKHAPSKRDPLDLVCRSRAERGSRNRNSQQVAQASRKH